MAALKLAAALRAAGDVAFAVLCLASVYGMVWLTIVLASRAAGGAP